VKTYGTNVVCKRVRAHSMSILKMKRLTQRSEAMVPVVKERIFLP